MKIIDAHCHIFPPEIITNRERIASREAWFSELYRDSRQRLASAEELVASMDGAQVQRSVVFGFAFNDPGLCHLCNAYVLEATHRYPGKMLPFLVVQPKYAPSALHELTDCFGKGALGLGELLPDGQGYALDDWNTLDPIMEYLRSANKPVMLHVNEQLGHTYPGKGKNGVVAGYTLGTHYSDNKLILSHWGGGLLFYELMPEVRRTLHNVYYDTAASAFLYDDRIFADALSWMPDKILWASDYPLLSQKRFIKRIEALALPLEQRERLFWRNTVDILGLDEVLGEGNQV
ncbi:MAG: amidohydrolase family protein [Chloroflexi bacterium]|nr:amidohydrolase family protein [Chloroflexota bacterium]